MTKFERRGRYIDGQFAGAAYAAFRSGADTMDIARLFKCQEYEAARAVRIGREMQNARETEAAAE